MREEIEDRLQERGNADECAALDSCGADVTEDKRTTSLVAAALQYLKIRVMKLLRE